MSVRKPKQTVQISSGISADASWLSASRAACAMCSEHLSADSVDLAILFISRHHVDHAAEIVEVIRSELRPASLVGAAAEGVVGGSLELEGAPGISLLAMRLPGVEITPFCSEQFMPVDDSDEGIDRLAATLGVHDGKGPLRATLFFADPFTTPHIKLLPAMNRALRLEKDESAPSCPIIGGLASSATSAGGNALMLDGRVMRSGAVGVTLRGRVQVDTVVSQGCRPFGPAMIVTKARGNIIFQLGGRPAMHAVQEAIETLENEQRPLLEQGLYIGRVINEYKDRFGRSDFLIRNVLGADPNTGALAIGDMIRVGQTVQLHVRDATTADEDLAMLLDAQKLYDRPAGAMLVTCNGRGSKMFSTPNHDASAFVKAFMTPEGGEIKAKGGVAIDPKASPMPLAGFFAAAEIGPVSGRSFVHGQTACAALFRSPR